MRSCPAISPATGPTQDLNDRHLRTPVLYPGSIERTSFAEKSETKGYLLLTVGNGKRGRPPSLDWRFEDLPARPMVRLSVQAKAMDSRASIFASAAASTARSRQHRAAADQGPVRRERFPLLKAAYLREICPPDMNINLGFSSSNRHRRGRSRLRGTAPDAGGTGEGLVARSGPRGPGWLSRSGSFDVFYAFQLRLQLHILQAEHIAQASQLDLDAVRRHHPGNDLDLAGQIKALGKIDVQPLLRRAAAGRFPAPSCRRIRCRSPGCRNSTLYPSSGREPRFRTGTTRRRTPVHTASACSSRRRSRSERSGCSPPRRRTHAGRFA